MLFYNGIDKFVSTYRKTKKYLSTIKQQIIKHRQTERQQKRHLNDKSINDSFKQLDKFELNIDNDKYLRQDINNRVD